jgi:hypothetical protein
VPRCYAPMEQTHLHREVFHRSLRPLAIDRINIE